MACIDLIKEVLKQLELHDQIDEAICSHFSAINDELQLFLKPLLKLVANRNSYCSYADRIFKLDVYFKFLKLWKNKVSTDESYKAQYDSKIEKLVVSSKQLLLIFPYVARWVICERSFESIDESVGLLTFLNKHKSWEEPRHFKVGSPTSYLVLYKWTQKSLSNSLDALEALLNKDDMHTCIIRMIEQYVDSFLLILATTDIVLTEDHTFKTHLTNITLENPKTNHLSRFATKVTQSWSSNKNDIFWWLNKWKNRKQVRKRSVCEDRGENKLSEPTLEKSTLVYIEIPPDYLVYHKPTNKTFAMIWDITNSLRFHCEDCTQKAGFYAKLAYMSYYDTQNLSLLVAFAGSLLTCIAWLQKRAIQIDLVNYYQAFQSSGLMSAFFDTKYVNGCVFEETNFLQEPQSVEHIICSIMNNFQNSFVLFLCNVIIKTPYCDDTNKLIFKKIMEEFDHIKCTNYQAFSAYLYLISVIGKNTSEMILDSISTTFLIVQLDILLDVESKSTLSRNLLLASRINILITLILHKAPKAVYLLKSYMSHLLTVKKSVIKEDLLKSYDLRVLTAQLYQMVIECHNRSNSMHPGYVLGVFWLKVAQACGEDNVISQFDEIIATTNIPSWLTDQIQYLIGKKPKLMFLELAVSFFNEYTFHSRYQFLPIVDAFTRNSDHSTFYNYPSQSFTNCVLKSSSINFNSFYNKTNGSCCKLDSNVLCFTPNHIHNSDNLSLHIYDPKSDLCGKIVKTIIYQFINVLDISKVFLNNYIMYSKLMENLIFGCQCIQYNSFRLYLKFLLQSLISSLATRFDMSNQEELPLKSRKREFERDSKFKYSIIICSQLYRLIDCLTKFLEKNVNDLLYSCVLLVYFQLHRFIIQVNKIYTNLKINANPSDSECFKSAIDSIRCYLQYIMCALSKLVIRVYHFPVPIYPHTENVSHVLYKEMKVDTLTWISWVLANVGFIKNINTDRSRLNSSILTSNIDVSHNNKSPDNNKVSCLSVCTRKSRIPTFDNLFSKVKVKTDIFIVDFLQYLSISLISACSKKACFFCKDETSCLSTYDMLTFLSHMYPNINLYKDQLLANYLWTTLTRPKFGNQCINTKYNLDFNTLLLISSFLDQDERFIIYICSDLLNDTSGIEGLLKILTKQILDRISTIAKLIYTSYQITICEVCQVELNSDWDIPEEFTNACVQINKSNVNTAISVNCVNTEVNEAVCAHLYLYNLIYFLRSFFDNPEQYFTNLDYDIVKKKVASVANRLIQTILIFLQTNHKSKELVRICLLGIVNIINEFQMNLDHEISNTLELFISTVCIVEEENFSNRTSYSDINMSYVENADILCEKIKFFMASTGTSEDYLDFSTSCATYLCFLQWVDFLPVCLNSISSWLCLKLLEYQSNGVQDNDLISPTLSILLLTLCILQHKLKTSPKTIKYYVLQKNFLYWLKGLKSKKLLAFFRTNKNISYLTIFNSFSVQISLLLKDALSQFLYIHVISNRSQSIINSNFRYSSDTRQKNPSYKSDSRQKFSNYLAILKFPGKSFDFMWLIESIDSQVDKLTLYFHVAKTVSWLFDIINILLFYVRLSQLKQAIEKNYTIDDIRANYILKYFAPIAVNERNIDKLQNDLFVSNQGIYFDIIMPISVDFAKINKVALDVCHYYCRLWLSEIFLRTNLFEYYSVVYNIISYDSFIGYQIQKASELYGSSIRHNLCELSEQIYFNEIYFYSTVNLRYYLIYEAKLSTSASYSITCQEPYIIDDQCSDNSSYSYGLEFLLLLIKDNPIFNQELKLANDYRNSQLKSKLKTLLLCATTRTHLLIHKFPNDLHLCSSSIFLNDLDQISLNVYNIVNNTILKPSKNQAADNDSANQLVMSGSTPNISPKLQATILWLTYIFYVCDSHATFIKDLLLYENPNKRELLDPIQSVAATPMNLKVQLSKKRTVIEFFNLTYTNNTKYNFPPKKLFFSLIEYSNFLESEATKRDSDHQTFPRKYLNSAVWPQSKFDWIENFTSISTYALYQLYSKNLQFPSPSDNADKVRNCNHYEKLLQKQKPYAYYIISAILNILNSLQLKKHGKSVEQRTDELYQNLSSFIPHNQLLLIELILQDDLLRLYSWFSLNMGNQKSQIRNRKTCGFFIRNPNKPQKRFSGSFLSKSKGEFLQFNIYVASHSDKMENHARLGFKIMKYPIFFKKANRARKSSPVNYPSKNQKLKSYQLLKHHFKKKLKSNKSNYSKNKDLDYLELFSINKVLYNPHISLVNNWFNKCNKLELQINEFRQNYELLETQTSCYRGCIRNKIRFGIKQTSHAISWKHLNNVWFMIPPILGNLQQRFFTCRSLQKETCRFIKKFPDLILFCYLANPEFNMYHLHFCITNDILCYHTRSKFSVVAKYFSLHGTAKRRRKKSIRTHLIRFPWIYMPQISMFYLLPLLDASYKNFVLLKSIIIKKALECQTSNSIKLFLPQLVQSLRNDSGRLIEEMLAAIALKFPSIAILILFQLSNEVLPVEVIVKEKTVLPFIAYRLINRILRDSKVFHEKVKLPQDFLKNQWEFFNKLIDLSTILRSIQQQNRKSALESMLTELIPHCKENLLLWPLSGNLRIISFNPRKVKIMQSAAKVPFMVQFEVAKIIDVDLVRQLCVESIHRKEAFESIDFSELFDYDVQSVSDNLSLIFKSHDDVRQDQLALQIIGISNFLFKQNKSPLNLHLYSVIPVRSLNDYIVGGIIEVVPHSMSRHQLGKNYECSLFEYFRNQFNDVQTISVDDHVTPYSIAQWQFMRSLAACCVMSYILQVKDRHNGNLLITHDGTIIHIDFGFLFDTSPGRDLNFEKAPFKLTLEMIEILGGSSKSETYRIFEQLIIQGFFMVRENAPLFLQLVSNMMNSGLPCLKSKSLQNFRSRLRLEADPQETAAFMKKLISLSYNALSTRLYDVVQSIQQGIAH